MFATFMGELTTMKRQFDLLRRRPLMEHTFPRFAGGAIWALHFQHRLTKPMALLMDTTPYLLENHCSPDFGAQCNLLVTSIEQVTTTFSHTYSLFAYVASTLPPHHTKVFVNLVSYG